MIGAIGIVGTKAALYIDVLPPVQTAGNTGGQAGLLASDSMSAHLGLGLLAGGVISSATCCTDPALKVCLVLPQAQPF